MATVNGTSKRREMADDAGLLLFGVKWP